jgi:hypothetical protein
LLASPFTGVPQSVERLEEPTAKVGEVREGRAIRGFLSTMVEP